jgi:hypothetical protein
VEGDDERDKVKEDESSSKNRNGEKAGTVVLISIEGGSENELRIDAIFASTFFQR